MDGRRLFRGLQIIILASAPAFNAAPSPATVARAAAAPACTCVTLRADASYRGHDAVFAGTATEVEYLDPPETHSEPRIVVTFEVRRSWKGAAAGEFFLHTNYNSYTCQGYYFKKGKEYLVFARRNKEPHAKAFAPHALPEVSYGTSLCSGTKLLADAGEDVKILDGLGEEDADAPGKRGARR
jgi:hypothetical protein